jgi:hypothetical protein
LNDNESVNHEFMSVNDVPLQSEMLPKNKTVNMHFMCKESVTEALNKHSFGSSSTCNNVVKNYIV